MSDESSVAMTAEERDDFLGRGGTGVLSLSTPESAPPHSIPVSYGYDATEGVFYFRLAVDDDSDKGQLDERPVTFVTHRERDDGWQSVVASGRLASTMETAIATDTLEGLERVEIPLVDIFGRPPRVVSFEFFRLVPDEIDGRKEVDTSP